MGRTHTGLPRYATVFADRHGTRRIRFRRKGWPSVYVHAQPGTPEFTQAYYEWLNTEPMKPGASGVIPHSFDDLIGRYYQTAEFAELKPLTHKAYRSILEQFRERYGDMSAATIKARHLTDIFDMMRDRPTQANNLRKRLGRLFKLAIHLEWRTDNPISSTDGLKVQGDGFQTWQEDHIRRYRRRWKLGTMPRLAFDLALYTGQRRGDIIAIGVHDMRDGRIHLVQEKTGKSLAIPIHRNLRRSLAIAKHGDQTLLVTAYGKPFTTNGFGNWFHDKAKAAGLQGYEFHGLRKAAARRLAEAGCTNAEIKAITGHVTDAEVARYTRAAEQETLANSAMRRLEKSNRRR